MILGILIGMYMGLYNISIALFFCLEAIILYFSFRVKYKKIFILCFVIFFSFSYAKIVEVKFDRAFEFQENVYLAKVISLKEEEKYYNKYTLQIKAGKYKNNRILVYSKEDLKYGDIVKFSEKIEFPEKARNDKRI